MQQNLTISRHLTWGDTWQGSDGAAAVADPHGRTADAFRSLRASGRQPPQYLVDSYLVRDGLSPRALRSLEQQRQLEELVWGGAAAS